MSLFGRFLTSRQSSTVKKNRIRRLNKLEAANYKIKCFGLWLKEIPKRQKTLVTEKSEVYLRLPGSAIIE